jgi:hypothetical protein
MSGSVWQLPTICKDCILFCSSGLFLAYGVLVFIASVAPFAEPKLQKTKGAIRSASRRPPMIGELGEITKPRPSIGALVLQLFLNIASFRFFAYLVGEVLDFIRTVFFMRDKPSFVKSFLAIFFSTSSLFHYQQLLCLR